MTLQLKNTAKLICKPGMPCDVSHQITDELVRLGSVSLNISSSLVLQDWRKSGMPVARWKTFTFGCGFPVDLDQNTMTDLSFQVDRGLVLSKGREAVGKLLVELQVRKSTADAAGAREYYTTLTKPIPGWEGEIRDMVLRKKLVHPDSSHLTRQVPHLSSF